MLLKGKTFLIDEKQALQATINNAEDNEMKAAEIKRFIAETRFPNLPPMSTFIPRGNVYQEKNNLYKEKFKMIEDTSEKSLFVPHSGILLLQIKVNTDIFN